MLNKLGSAWRKKDKDGNTMISGEAMIIGKFVLLKNKRKEKATQPDYILYLSDDKQIPLKVTTEKVTNDEDDI